MHTRMLLLTLSALAAAAPAQTSTAVALPSGNLVALAESHTLLFGEPRQRVQIVVGAAHLWPLAGAALDSLRLRHLNETAVPIHGGQVRLELALSHAALPPTAVQTRFAANHGQDRSVVFSRDVVIAPASAAGGSGPTPWDDPRNVHLPFDRPFPYLGGPLCLELSSAAVTGQPLPLWLADGAGVAGLPLDNQLYGAATAGSPPSFRPTQYGLAAPGERFDLDLDGVPPGMPAVLVLGLDDSSWMGLPLPLRVHTSAGRGVFLLASPDLTLAALSASHASLPNLGDLPLDPVALGRFGYASVRFRFPFDPAVAGTTLFAQWLALTELDVNGAPRLLLAATQGLRLPVCAGRRHLDIAFLQAESQDPAAALDTAAETTLRFSPVVRLSGTR